MLYKCPLCGSFLNMFIDYSYGYPMTVYSCPNSICGYDSRNEKITIDNKTHMGRHIATINDRTLFMGDE